MSDVYVKTINEHIVEGKRLGRHVEHDPRSKDYAFETTTTSYKNVSHERYGHILNQGELGSCTGNATAGAVNTAPLHKKGSTALVEADALALYELATQLDGIPGQYPPDDTGSSGLAAAKAAQQKGYITSYQHAFDMTAALAALQAGPVITGVNWYEGFDTPDENGLVSISGSVRGGHEFRVYGFHLEDDVNDSLVMCANSWGTDWGVKGLFHFTVATWQQLLDEEGDVTILLN